MTEHQIQTFLWENRDRWADIIEKVEFPKKYIFHETDESIYNRTPDKVLYNEIIDRYTEIYENLSRLRLFGHEVPLKREGENTIRADMLGLIDRVPGIAIIEIKKSAQTERQAYTELFAYASHLHAIFPTMCNDDIHYVLISPMEERIVREASVYSFLFDEKPVFAFIPTYENNDVTTIKLRPWLPKLEDVNRVTESAFSHKNFIVFKGTWNDVVDRKTEDDDNPGEEMISRMNKISSYAAQIMEKKKIHGFVYTSKSYPDSPLPGNSIILVGLNPFKVAKDNYLLQERHISAGKLDSVADEEINLHHIMPELLNKAKEVNEQNQYFYDLTTTWVNTLAEIAFDTITLMTTNKSKLAFDQGYRTMSWKVYQNIILEDNLCFNFDIFTTGLIRKLFAEYTIQDYQYIEKFGYENHPYLYHGDVPEFVVDYLNEQVYFRDFLYNMFEYYKWLL